MFSYLLLCCLMGVTLGGHIVLPGVKRLPPNTHRSLPDNQRIIFPGQNIPEVDTPVDVNLEDQIYENETIFPEINSFDELSLHNLELLNNAEISYEEILNLLSIDLPLPTPQKKPIISSRAGIAKKTKTLKGLRPAGCKLTLKPIELNITKELNTMYIPSCVWLHRCDGCCVGSFLSCQAIDTEEIEIEVLKLKFPEKQISRRSRVRRRRRSNTVYETIKVLNHTSCDCKCQIMEQHCDPALHTYLKSACKCLCNNKDEQRKCLKQNETHFWDSKTCKCICRDKHACSSGEVFSHSDCRCVSQTVSGRSGINRDTSTSIETKPDLTRINLDHITSSLPFTGMVNDRNRKPILLLSGRKPMRVNNARRTYDIFG